MDDEKIYAVNRITQSKTWGEVHYLDDWFETKIEAEEYVSDHYFADVYIVESDKKTFMESINDELKFDEEFEHNFDEYNDVKNDDELVQYFIVNSELNMSAGKIAGQVAHVAMNIAHQMYSTLPLSNNALVPHEIKNEVINFHKWYRSNQTKIILRGKQKEMEKLIENGWYYIRDNGRTEISVDSLTVIGHPPEYKSVMKPIVKRFQLL